MGLLDKFEDLIAKWGPKSRLGGGIGSGHGMVADDDLEFLLRHAWTICCWMIVSKPAIVFHTAQIFFNFISLCCFASIAAFQAKWNVGPSGLSGFALFVSIFGIFLSAFMLLIPVAYEKYNKFIRLAHALKEVRVGFILTGTGVTFSLLIAFIVTVSVWTQPGCKDANQDPSAEANGDDFKKALPGWCNTKKAAAIFFWFAFLFWAASLTILVLDWRSGKLYAHHARDQSFQPPTRPQDEEEGEEVVVEEEDYQRLRPTRQESRPAPRPSAGYDSNYYTQSSSPPPSQQQQQSRYGGLPPISSSSSQQTPLTYASPAAGRPSLDAYGAFSDPAPSGFGSSSGYGRTPTTTAGGAITPSIPPTIPESDFGPPTTTGMMSRTMQYADPYAAVRASIGGGASPGVPSGAALPPPPSYESYGGYR